MNYYSTFVFSAPNTARALFLIVLFITVYANLYADGWPQSKNSSFAKLYYFSSSAPSYFGTDGLEVVEFKEYDSINSRDRRYATDFSSAGVGIYGEYRLMKQLRLTLDFPFASFGLKETYSIDDKHLNYETRREFSLSQYNWIGLGARWQIIKTKHFATSFIGEIRVPPGFSSPDTGRADYPFLSDGSFQVIGGTEISYSFTNGWIEAEARYNRRGDDFKDEALLHIEGGFSNIPETYLKIFANATISANNFDNIRPFNPIQSQLQETTYDIGCSFMAFVSDNWFLEASYSIRAYGLNTWSMKTLVIGGGITIPALHDNAVSEE